MRFHDFRSAMRDFPVFSLQDARALEPTFDRRRLTEWQQRGLLHKLNRGHYLFSDVDVDDGVRFAAASKLYPPSYVSFETALAFYGIIPESVHVVVSAATRKTAHFETPIGRFSYHCIATSRFFGYRAVGGKGSMAELGKALLDYFYIHTNVVSTRDFDSLRLNVDVLRDSLDRERLGFLLRRTDQRRLTRRMAAFTEWLDHA